MYTNEFLNISKNLPKTSNDKALDSYIRRCKPQIRGELERAYREVDDQGHTLDLMKAIRLAKTADKQLCFAPGRFNTNTKLSAISGPEEVDDLPKQEVDDETVAA